MHEVKIMFSFNVTQCLRIRATFTSKLGSLTSVSIRPNIPVRIPTIFKYENSSTARNQNFFRLRRRKKERSMFSTNLLSTHSRCAKFLTSYNIQRMSNISFSYNHIVLVVILGVHTVYYLPYLGRLQVLQKIVFIDGILDQLLRSGKTNQCKLFEKLRTDNRMNTSAI